MLVHSCIYYVLNANIIDDRQWDEWARELKELQEQYPEIAQQVTLNEYFNDWDATTGAFLPIKESWVIALSNKVLRMNGKVGVKSDAVKVVKKENKVSKRRLF